MFVKPETARKYLCAEKPTFGGEGGYNFKLASQYPSWGLGHIDIQACPARFLLAQTTSLIQY